MSTGDYQVWRADLDGANPELLVDDLERAEQLVVDLDEGKIYWCGEDASANGLIQRANLDGSVFEADFITTGRNYPADLALKLDDPKTLYWCVWDGSDARYEIRKAALDPPLSAEEDVVTSNSMLTAGMAYHDGYLYWGAPLWNRIYKLPDGGGNADVVDLRLAGDVVEIAIDGVDEKLYWANDHSVYQAKLDGSGSGAGWWVCQSNDLSGMALLK